MPVHNTEHSYGSASKFFHWLIGLMIIGLLGVGIWMTDLENGPFKFQVYGIHKAMGIIVLTLATLRLLWRLRQVTPLLPESTSLWQKKASQYAHVALYVVMFMMPLSGWAMSNAAGYQVSVFGLFTMPNIVSANPKMRTLFGNIHTACGYAAIGLVALHVGAALQHHFLKRDDVLKRMLPNIGKKC